MANSFLIYMAMVLHVSRAAAYLLSHIELIEKAHGVINAHPGTRLLIHRSNQSSPIPPLPKGPKLEPVEIPNEFEGLDQLDISPLYRSPMGTAMERLPYPPEMHPDPMDVIVDG
eukprot:505284_1